ncbi:MAG: ABC transporter ATP-binding protein [Paracoccaceae bacterium]
MTPALTLSHLTKRYAGTAALSDVSLSVAAGQRVALLGHNGAGKSTLMKIVLGLIGYDAGEISVLGAPPGSNAAREVTAYLPENVAFHPALTGREQIAHYLRLRGMKAAGAADLLARVGLADAMNRRIGTYSKGMRQRVGLAQALIGEPGLLILDEPTSGLDPVSRHEFYGLLDDLAARGAAILLSSHALTEVEARTDSIAILSQGRLVATGSMAELRAHADLPVAVHISAGPHGLDAIRAAFPAARIADDRVALLVPQSAKLDTLARIAALDGHVADVDVIPPSLEDIYTQISRGAAA